MGLVVQLEHNPCVVLVGSGYLGPVGDGVSVSHILLATLVPVQVDDDSHTKGIDPSDLLLNLSLVGGTTRSQPEVLAVSELEMTTSSFQ